MNDLEKSLERIVGAFDEWLAVQVLKHQLTHEQLPRLNQAIRDYLLSCAKTPTSFDSVLLHMPLGVRINFQRERDQEDDGEFLAASVYTARWNEDETIDSDPNGVDVEWDIKFSVTTAPDAPSTLMDLLINAINKGGFR